MDIALIIFVAVIALAGYIGYRRGVFSVIGGLVSLIAAYLVAIFVAPTLGQWLQSHSPFNGLMAYGIAGAILFISTSSILGFIFSRITRATSDDDGAPNSASAISGALVGLVVGIFVGIFVVWFFSTIKALLQAKQGVPVEPAAGFELTVKNTAGRMVSKASQLATGDDDFARVTAVLITSPAENVARINRINQTGSLQNLLYSNRTRVALDSRDPAALLHSPAFQRLANNSDFMALASDMGFSKRPATMQREVAVKITQLWSQVKQVQNDPEFLRITQNPEFQRLAQSGNIYKVMNNPDVEALFRLIASADVPEITYRENTAQENSIEKQSTPQQTTKIHRWVDDQGRVHYSDKKPESDEDSN